MMTDDVFQRLLGIFREVLDNDSLELQRESTADHVDGWDSLAQMRILIETEKSFGIRLDILEINSLPDVGALLDTVHRKLAEKSA